MAVFGSVVRGGIGRILLLYAGAVVAGYCFAQLRIPLPWMIGPMLLAAATAVAGRAPAAPRAIRSLGQLIVATAVGLYFTPAAVAELASQAGYMVAAAIFTIVAGCVTAVLLTRMARVDATTAFFASVPGGPVEMALLAERFNRPGAPVALAQTLRIALIVTFIPPLLLWSEMGSNLGIGRAPGSVDGAGLVLLYLLSGAVALLFARLRLANAFFLGPLAAAAVITALDIRLSAIPYPLLAAGQVLIGVSLGSKFDRALLLGAHRFLLAALVSTALLLGLSALAALAIAAAGDLPIATMVLATAPGSVTEMAVTAKTLDMNVALVTGFHVVRIFIVIPLTPVLFRTAHGLLRGRPVPGPGDD